MDRTLQIRPAKARSSAPRAEECAIQRCGEDSVTETDGTMGSDAARQLRITVRMRQQAARPRPQEVAEGRRWMQGDRKLVTMIRPGGRAHESSPRSHVFLCSSDLFCPVPPSRR